MQRLKTIHTREMFSKKEQAARKFLTLSRIFLLVRPLFSCIYVEHLYCKIRKKACQKKVFFGQKLGVYKAITLICKELVPCTQHLV